MQPTGSILDSLFPQSPRTFHLFISHSWDYGDDRTNLGSLIVNGLSPDNALDYSAPSDDPIHTSNSQQLLLALNQRISQAGLLIFPAGVYASYSAWIPVEISIAQQLQKPIIAVEKWGSQRSSSMAEQAHEVVGWNSNSVASAIRRWHS
jgi:hypothetical protein